MISGAEKFFLDIDKVIQLSHRKDFVFLQQGLLSHCKKKILAQKNILRLEKNVLPSRIFFLTSEIIISGVARILE